MTTLPSTLLARDPTVLLSQYGHTDWRVQEGAFGSAPNVIAQTADGYIWIGTNAGLVRFDGVRFQSWTPPQKDLSGTAVLSLLSASDGTFWIGTATGLLSWKNDHLEERISGRIAAILEDHRRRIWVVRSLAEPSGGLCQVVGDHPGCIGSGDRLPLLTAAALAEDVNGNLWIGAANQLMRWHDGSFEVYLKELAGYTVSSVTSIAAAPDGSVWTAIPREGFGVFHIVNNLPAKAVIQGLDTTQITTVFLARDRSLWMGTIKEGVYRLSGDRVDQFRTEHGLSSNTVTGFFEDREGNMWLATSKGLYCLRQSPVVTFSTTEGLAPALGAMLASGDGTIWIGSAGRLDALRGDSVTSMRFGGRSVNALFEDSAGRLWIGLENTLTVNDGGRFREINRLDGHPLGTPIAITEDREHNVWASVGITTTLERKLFRIRDLRVQEEFAPDRVPLVRRLAADPTGGMWLGFEDGNLGHYANGKLETFPLPHSAVATAEARFPGLTIDPDGSAWVSTWSGLVRWKNREMKTLTSKNGLPCDAIVSTIRDADATLWLYTKCGFIAIVDSELEQWWRQPERMVHARVLDVFDGAVLPQGPKRLQPVASKSPDGRLWFVNESVLQMIDPVGLRKNGSAPPVYVEELRADRKDYAIDGLVRLPARSRDIEIGYTGLSFATPQEVRFRYRLEGRDQEWQDAGTRRRAFYTDLRPGTYRFHVIASNGDGRWTEEGATVAFNVAPAWYQTRTFDVLATLCAGGILSALYRMRVRHIARTMRRQFDERLAERTRMARELHDTFVQTIHASKLVADDALEHPDDAAYVQGALGRLSQWLERAVQESRAALHSLRASTTQVNDLADAFRRATTEDLKPPSMAISFSVVGDAKDIHPIVRYEIYRIGYEAIRNAVTHSAASHLDVELRYAKDLTVRVTDNGVGIDPTVARRGKDGHFGLQSMRERAGRIGARLDVVSSTAGTEVMLTVPGSMLSRPDTAPAAS